MRAYPTSPVHVVVGDALARGVWRGLQAAGLAASGTTSDDDADWRAGVVATAASKAAAEQKQKRARFADGWAESAAEGHTFPAAAMCTTPLQRGSVSTGKLSSSSSSSLPLPWSSAPSCSSLVSSPIVIPPQFPFVPVFIHVQHHHDIGVVSATSAPPVADCGLQRQLYEQGLRQCSAHMQRDSLGCLFAQNCLVACGEALALARALTRYDRSADKAETAKQANAGTTAAAAAAAAIAAALAMPAKKKKKTPAGEDDDDDADGNDPKKGRRKAEKRKKIAADPLGIYSASASDIAKLDSNKSSSSSSRRRTGSSGGGGGGGDGKKHKHGKKKKKSRRSRSRSRSRSRDRRSKKSSSSSSSRHHHRRK